MSWARAQLGRQTRGRVLFALVFGNEILTSVQTKSQTLEAKGAVAAAGFLL